MNQYVLAGLLAVAVLNWVLWGIRGFPGLLRKDPNMFAVNNLLVWPLFGGVAFVVWLLAA